MADPARDDSTALTAAAALTTALPSRQRSAAATTVATSAHATTALATTALATAGDAATASEAAVPAAVAMPTAASSWHRRGGPLGPFRQRGPFHRELVVARRADDRANGRSGGAA